MQACAFTQSFMESLLTADEVAALVRICRRTFDTLYLKGEGPVCVKIGRQRFWRTQDIEQWLEGLVEKKPGPVDRAAKEPGDGLTGE